MALDDAARQMMSIVNDIEAISSKTNLLAFNATIIGRSIATINDDDPGSHVISLTSTAAGHSRWVYRGLPGHSEDAGRLLDETTMNRVHMPRLFYHDVLAALKPGTTVLITQSSVGEDGTGPGQRLTLMDSLTPTP